MKPRPPAQLQIPFDRVTYRQGQALASRDLHDDFENAERLRRMHTQFLHGTWGIGLGFSVSGQVSDTSVAVGSGYALDSSAREILSQDQLLPVPQTPAAADLLLVATYVADSEFRNVPDPRVLCAGTSSDPRAERPAFYWRTPDTFVPGPDVPLAHLRVQNGALISLPDLSVRRYARPLVRPHIGTGAVQASGAAIASGLQVDTSDAGFAHNPEYFARLDFEGNPLIQAVSQFGANSAYVESSSAQQFVYRAPELRNFGGGLLLEQTFTVTWVGVEPVTGCQPIFNPILIYSLAAVQLSQGVIS
jgi:hypothetical protein